MKIQLGSGNIRLPGFVNVDIRPLAETDVVGHAGDLHCLGDGSVDVLFSHALFEHVFLRHQVGVIREWGRVLARDGVVVCLGVPDFETIARLYLEGARGVIGERFDLFNVYRYTHGEPEHAARGDWASWRPERHPDSAPPGWLPQLHKGLFDAGYLSSLFEAGGLAATVFRYAYPGEEHALNLGAVAAHRGGRACLAEPEAVRSRIRLVPEVGRFVVPESVSVAESSPRGEGLVAHAMQADPGRRVPTSLARRALRRVGRAIRLRGRGPRGGRGTPRW